MNLIERYRARKRVQDFMRAHGMTFHGFGGLVVNELVANEFGYLLRYLTDGKLDSFSDLRKICGNRELILDAIDVELAKELPRESEVFHYPREIAEGNLLNLRVIVETTCEYVDLCDRYRFGIHEFLDEKDGPFQKLSSAMGGAIVAASLAALLFNLLDGTFERDSLALLAGLAGGLGATILTHFIRHRKEEVTHD